LHIGLVNLKEEVWTIRLSIGTFLFWHFRAYEHSRILLTLILTGDLHNKPKAAVRAGACMLTGPREEEHGMR
jgi:hypothetical protein